MVGGGSVMGTGLALKDARGHEYEKGERVEDRKYMSRVDMRAWGIAKLQERFNAFPR